MASAIISVNGLVKKFGGVAALNSVNLEIQKGELFGLLGPNGAGKTTLISILSTILPATSGSASVCGYDVRREQSAVRKCIGIVFQDPSLDDDLTGDENLDFHGRLYGLNAVLRRQRIGEVLKLVDLENRRHDLVKTYSGGMRRRLEIARGLMHRPEVLFLDEPTLGLDPQARRNIWDYIRDLKACFGMTVILTTHYMDEADQLCSRIAVIDRGEIVALDSPDELKAGLGGDVLELEVIQDDKEFTDRLLAMDGVHNIGFEDQRIVLRVNHGEAVIPKVFEIAQGLGVAINSVSMRKPNLEDVFIQLTGREMREAPVTEPTERMRIFMLRRKR
ncbi:MAG: ATP-binding cassette domain-containing protein [Desulfomonile tiedjei]|uniref:ATP-binding cassette domain-containing protein n=1 Tax=Desulfomonile tiedjei TaxID=2358 RepID=A0A9D6V734_9BACT|nr:ATP-binding cassette domain-containing protein [Desulfomonile tiedjei]